MQKVGRMRVCGRRFERQRNSGAVHSAALIRGCAYRRRRRMGVGIAVTFFWCLACVAAVRGADVSLESGVAGIPDPGRVVSGESMREEQSGEGPVLTVPEVFVSATRSLTTVGALKESVTIVTARSCNSRCWHLPVEAWGRSCLSSCPEWRLVTCRGA